VTNLQLLTWRPQPERADGRRVPYYALRCAVRPGITGWAQIRYGYANSLDEGDGEMRYDLYYIKHMSFGSSLASSSTRPGTSSRQPQARDGRNLARRRSEARLTTEVNR